MARHLSRSVVSWSLADVRVTWQSAGDTPGQGLGLIVCVCVCVCVQLPYVPQVHAVAFVKCADVGPDAETQRVYG